MNRRSRILVPALIAASLVVTACGTETTELPPGLGPLASSSEVALPADCQNATGTGSVTIGDARVVLANPSYNERRAKGCVNFPLSAVWQALQVPTGVDIGFYPERNDSDCEAWLITGSEYPINFVTKEIPHGGIESHYTFEITWRAGIQSGDSTNPTEVRMLYGKTSGTVEVPKILGSMVFTADPLHPGWTQIDVIRQLNTNGHSDDPGKLYSWLQGFYDGLKMQLNGQSITNYPGRCVLPAP